MPGLVPRLSGSFFVDKAHGVDSSVLKPVGWVERRRNPSHPIGFVDDGYRFAQPILRVFLLSFLDARLRVDPE
jgi:hypothetical protein